MSEPATVQPPRHRPSTNRPPRRPPDGDPPHPQSSRSAAARPTHTERNRVPRKPTGVTGSGAANRRGTESFCWIGRRRARVWSRTSCTAGPDRRRGQRNRAGRWVHVVRAGHVIPGGNGSPTDTTRPRFARPQRTGNHTTRNGAPRCEETMGTTAPLRSLRPDLGRELVGTAADGGIRDLGVLYATAAAPRHDVQPGIRDGAGQDSMQRARIRPLRTGIMSPAGGRRRRCPP